MNFESEEINKIFQYLFDRSPRINLDASIKNFFINKCVLITGGAGSIGKHISSLITSCNPKKIIVLDQAETPLHTLELKLNSKYPSVDQEFIICDIRDKSTLEQIFKLNQVDIVYHAAAYKHVHIIEKYPIQAVSTNIEGTKNITDCCLAFHVKKLIFISSDKAVNPTNVMGASKRIAELYLQSIQKENMDTTEFCIVRFGNIFGSDGSVIPLFLDQIHEKHKLTLTDPNAERYFISIQEACELIIRATIIGESGNIYLPGGIKKIRLSELVKQILAYYNLSQDKVIIETTGFRLGEKLSEELKRKHENLFTTSYDNMIMLKNEITAPIELKTQIEKLINSKKCNNMEIVSKMKAIIPEYTSVNSPYEILDKSN